MKKTTNEKQFKKYIKLSNNAIKYIWKLFANYLLFFAIIKKSKQKINNI